MRTLTFALLLSTGFASSLAAETGYKLIDKYAVGGTGGWDYVTVDSVGRRIYVSHATQVDVLDADTGKPVGIIPDTPGVHGIAIATKHNKGFTSNGREHTVSVFDPKTLKLIEKVPVGKGPDGIYYDAQSDRVFTCNHGSHDITALDAKTGKVVGTVDAKGDGEQMVTGADGTLFVNLEDTAEVIAFDAKTLQVKKRFPIEGAKTPTGLAIDTKTNRLFTGCRSKSMVVMDAATGKKIASFPIGATVDAAGFDPEAKLIFFSNGDGTLSIIREKSADEYEDAGTVTTQPSAKTMAFDPKTKRIFLPAAEFDMVPAKDTNSKPVRTVKPDSLWFWCSASNPRPVTRGQ